MTFEMAIDLTTVPSRAAQKVWEFVLVYPVSLYLISVQTLSREGCTGSAELRFPLNRDSAMSAFHLEKHGFFLTAGCCSTPEDAEKSNVSYKPS